MAKQRLKKSAVVFNKTPHTYSIDGKELKGVTSILHSLPMFSSMYETQSERNLKNNDVWKESGYKLDDLFVKSETYPDINIEPVDVDSLMFVCDSQKQQELINLIMDYQKDKIRLEINKFNAAKRGTAVHEACEAIDNGTTTDNEEAMKHANIYKSLREGIFMNPFATEYLVSDNEFVASSIDLVWQDEFDNFAIADIKCVSKMDETYRLYLTWQLSIYKYLFELQNPSKKISKIFGVWLPQKEQYGKASVFELIPIPEEEVKLMLDTCKKGEVYNPNVKPFELPALINNSMKEYLDAKTRIKKDTEFVKEIESEILKTFTRENIKKYDVEGIGSFTRTIPGVTQKFDLTRFKEENPEMYEQYLKTSETKPSLRVTLN